jgi:hypothetical protein
LCCKWCITEKDGARRFSDNRERRNIMGDKGGKKDKEKSQKQKSEKQQERARNQLNKQPKRKPL